MQQMPSWPVPRSQEGSNDCKMCPAGTSTGLLGSVSMSDCGCKAGFINIGDNGTFNCVPCSEGLDCPLASRIEDLKSGQSSSSEFAPWFHVAPNLLCASAQLITMSYYVHMGAQVPRIRRGYHSTMEAVQDWYRNLEGDHDDWSKQNWIL